MSELRVLDESWRTGVRRGDGVVVAEVLAGWVELREALGRAGFDVERPALPSRGSLEGGMILEAAARFKWADVLAVRDEWDRRCGRMAESASLVSGLLDRLDKLEADYAAGLEVAAGKSGGALPLPSDDRAAEAAAILARLALAGFESPAAARSWLARGSGSYGSLSASLIRGAAPLAPALEALLNARQWALVAGYAALLELHATRLDAAGLPRDAQAYRHGAAPIGALIKRARGRGGLPAELAPAAWVLGWMLHTVVAADDADGAQLAARREALLGAGR